MKPSLLPFISYAVGGAVCVGALLAYFPYLRESGPEPMAVAAVVYAGLGAVVVGLAGSRLVQVLAVWGFLTVICAVVAFGGWAAPDRWMRIFGGVEYGLLAFGVWASVGGAVLLLLRRLAKDN